MSYFPPVPVTDFMSGQTARLVLDYPLDGAFAYLYSTPREHGITHDAIDLVAEGIAINGPRTFTLDLVGPKIPCLVSFTVQDYTSGSPVNTTTDYTFGPSLTSQSITLADSNFTGIAITIIRRH